jgi:hypothetical protein
VEAGGEVEENGRRGRGGGVEESRARGWQRGRGVRTEKLRSEIACC